VGLAALVDDDVLLKVEGLTAQELGHQRAMAAQLAGRLAALGRPAGLLEQQVRRSGGRLPC
jgi:hypothetical protein